MVLLLPVLGYGLWLGYNAAVRWAAVAPSLTGTLTAVPPGFTAALGWSAGALGVMLLAVMLYGSALTVAARRRALARRGEVVWGALTSASAKLDGSDTLRLTVEYRFKEPKRWHVIVRRTFEGKVREPRNDLKGQPLPPPGTPIPVLYLNQDNYEVL